jgi:hypothetical protein
MATCTHGGRGAVLEDLPMINHDMAGPESVVCMFCNAAVDPGSQACRVTLEADWAEGSGVYWCHGRCLEAATHPAIPLYLLSLRRDAEVHGTGPADGEDRTGLQQ